MSDSDPGKEQAARAGAALVQPGMIVGLGSGTTASALIRALGDRVRTEGLKLVGVPTSLESEVLARSLNIEVRQIDDVDSIDLVLDGADQVDPRFQMIKGRGGALLREKIVACAARRRVILVTPEKRVERLGGPVPIPVEVSVVGLRSIERCLRALGAETSLRLRRDGSVFPTDGDNRIIDCLFAPVDDPSELDTRLQRVAGVFETGLFLGLCDTLIVGHPDHAESFDRPA